MLRQPLFFWSGCLSIQFSHLPLPLTQSVRPPMATYPSLCSPCVTYGMLCHAIGHQVLPIHPAISHPPVDYHRVFTPILYFQPSPVQNDSRLTPTTLFFTVSATDLRAHTPYTQGSGGFPQGLIYLSTIDLYRQVLFKLHDRSNL